MKPWRILFRQGRGDMNGPRQNHQTHESSPRYDGDNNGRLVACSKYLRTRGWSSEGTASRARKELEASRLIVETRKGMRPNRATWYALTWLVFDWSPDMDLPRNQFQRGVYVAK